MRISVPVLFHKLLRRPLSPQRFFLILAGGIGIVLVFVVPPFQAPDEHTHFHKEVALSRGHVMAQVLPYRVGSYLPEKYVQTSEYYRSLYLNSEAKLNVGVLKHDLRYPNLNNAPAITAYENTAQYPPLAYIPQAIAIFIAHGFTGSVLLQMYAARVATLLCWLTLVFLAIRALPFAKWGAVALTLTPLSLFLSISCSNDAITFGLSLLTIAYILAAVVNKQPIKRSEQMRLIALGATLGLCKVPYLLIVGLALSIPVKRFVDRKRYLAFLALLIGTSLALAMSWNLLARHIIINFYPGSDTAGQAHYILHHLPKTVIMIIKTLTVYPIGDDLFLQIIGLKAWIVAQTPFWLIGLSYTTIVIATLYTPVKSKFVVPPLTRYLSLVIAAGGVFFISLLLYITYTPVGLNTINGLQGRYFIPFFYLLIAAIGGLRGGSLTLNHRHFKVMLFVIAGIALSVLPLTISRYYSL